MRIDIWHRYKKWLLTLSLGICLASAIAFQMGRKSDRLEGDYVAAERLWRQWSESATAEKLGELEKIVQRRPELEALYGAKIAQQLFAKEGEARRRFYAEQSFKRTGLQPDYKSYAQTTLLIQEKHYEQALQEALGLKEKLASDPAFLQRIEDHRGLGSALIAFNLLRIAMLYQELGDCERELSAWEEFEHCDRNTKVIAHFTMQSQSLIDYLAMRKQALSQ
ncbi:MAG: hypothetical protein AAF443_08580 [Chlamydiota bacterium]